MANVLYTADWHLTGRPDDEYRWRILPWIAKRVERLQLGAVVIAGDLTDAKDNHSGDFVNRVVRELAGLAAAVPVHLLMGNHDYFDASSPFFRFLGRIKGLRYYAKAKRLDLLGRQVLFLPHQKDFTHLARLHLNLQGLQAVVMHQTVKGALSQGEDGKQRRLDGVDPYQWFAKLPKGCRVLSGDVHAPQVSGPVTYIGAPHHVHYGDGYTPQVLVDTGKELTTLYPKNISKWMIDAKDADGFAQHLRQGGAKEGDYVKARFVLDRSELAGWPTLVKQVQALCKDAGVHLHGCSILRVTEPAAAPGQPAPAGSTLRESYLAYCRYKQLDKATRKAGLRFLEQA